MRLIRYEGDHHWIVMSMYHRTTSEPHTVCTLVSELPFPGDRISTPEMRAILILSGARDCSEGYGHDKRFPVSSAPGAFPVGMKRARSMTNLRFHVTNSHAGHRCFRGRDEAPRRCRHRQ